MKKLAYAAFSGALFAAAMTSAASADVMWNVTGTFNDGGTLSGTFLINQYGYIDYNAGYDLVTTGGSVLPGFTYTQNDSYWSNGTFYVDFEPSDYGDLHLTFLDNLGVGSLDNPLVGGAPGPSWECGGSYSCYVPEGTIRYIASGYASTSAIGVQSEPVPEPLTISLFGAGLAGVAAMRRRKKSLI